MQNYVTFLFTGYFAFFKNWSNFEMAQTLHVFLNFELIFYHNYFTGLLVLPNNFGKFSAFWCKNIHKYNLHLLRNVCFYKRHMFTRWERKQSYLLNFEVYTHCKIILGERGMRVIWDERGRRGEKFIYLARKRNNNAIFEFLGWRGQLLKLSTVWTHKLTSVFPHASHAWTFRFSCDQLIRKL